MDYLLGKYNQQLQEKFLASPAHSLIVTGPKGIGKSKFIDFLAFRLLDIQPASDILNNQNYLNINSEKDSISIESVRSIQAFLKLKPSDNSKRVIVINRADQLTLEAQNAVLKTIEEPPQQTHVLMGSVNISSLLPTVVSRSQVINLRTPSSEEIIDHFKQKGFPENEIKSAILMSGSLPGMVDSLLSDRGDTIKETFSFAKSYIAAGKYDRLIMIEPLTKDKEKTTDFLFAVKRILKISLEQGQLTQKRARQLTDAIKLVLDCEQAVKVTNPNNKLLLTNLSVSL